MKKILITFLILLMGMGLFMSMGLKSLGTRPNSAEKSKFQSSGQYNKEKGVFENRRPGLIAEMRKRTMNFKMIKDWISKGVDRQPKDKMPEVTPDLKEFLSESSELKVIWFGHSTFLLNIGGKIILVDPVFSGSAAPFSFMVKRFQAPVLKLEELPELDLILISHDHYDHLDMQSIEYFSKKKVPFLTPLGVGSYLKGWGVSQDRITEKDWWESEKIGELEFSATPAQHFSGRDGLHDNETLWASWVIKGAGHSIYFSGDSGYDTHFKEIGDKYGPFDVAFLESGQYDERWKEVHMLPVEAAVAYKELKAQKYFPVHWGMFVLALHPWYDPIEQLFAMAEKGEINLLAPIIGKVVYPKRENKIETWWRE